MPKKTVCLFTCSPSLDNVSDVWFRTTGSGKLSFEEALDYNFAGNNFGELSLHGRIQKFVGKTFVDSQKNANVYTLESFPLSVLFLLDLRDEGTYPICD